MQAILKLRTNRDKAGSLLCEEFISLKVGLAVFQFTKVRSVPSSPKAFVSSLLVFDLLLRLSANFFRLIRLYDINMVLLYVQVVRNIFVIHPVDQHCEMKFRFASIMLLNPLL